MSDGYTRYGENVSRETVAAHQHKCEGCFTHLNVGERMVLYWDGKGQLFTLHKRCAREWGVVWQPIPVLVWERVTRMRWRATVGRHYYDVLRDGRTGWFGCLKDGELFDLKKDFLLARSRCEQRAWYDEKF